MAKDFVTNYREERILNRLDSSKDYLRDRQLQDLRKTQDDFCDHLAQKLVDEKLVVTTNRKELVRQLSSCCDELLKAEDFDVNYRIAPFRSLVQNPNFISLFLTAFVTETLVNHADVEDVYGTDEEIYRAIHGVLVKFVSMN